MVMIAPSSALMMGPAIRMDIVTKMASVSVMAAMAESRATFALKPLAMSAKQPAAGT